MKMKMKMRKSLKNMTTASCALFYLLFNYHKLALQYSDNEIEVSIDGGPLFGRAGNHLFTVIDDRIEEVHFYS